MEHYKFYQNKECEYFPCHKGVPEEEFNCMFCYCPLYYAECGGNGCLTASGIKDCTECTLPHGKDSHAYIIGKIMEINKRRKGKL